MSDDFSDSGILVAESDSLLAEGTPQHLIAEGTPQIISIRSMVARYDENTSVVRSEAGFYRAIDHLMTSGKLRNLRLFSINPFLLWDLPSPSGEVQLPPDDGVNRFLPLTFPWQQMPAPPVDVVEGGGCFTAGLRCYRRLREAERITSTEKRPVIFFGWLPEPERFIGKVSGYGNYTYRDRMYNSRECPSDFQYVGMGDGRGFISAIERALQSKV